MMTTPVGATKSDRGAPRLHGAHLPPALLTMANYHGTLAAVRSLGRSGVPVAAVSTAFAAARWSRYATESMTCPNVGDVDAFIGWLLKLGKRGKRYALLATSDDTAFLYSRYQSELREYFDLFQPSVDVIYNILNKKLLYEHCQAANVPMPRTWFPTNERELEESLKDDPRFPVLIKPRTQILFRYGNKGQRIDTPQELKAALPDFRRQQHHARLLEYDADASEPMVQEFHKQAENGIYNLTGYAGQDGTIWAFRAGRKILQRPRKIGVGLCFEAATVAPEAAEALGRLVKRIGFFGVFEAEFIVTGSDYLLIDFNPRFFNQMGFDEARGLPLAMLAYLTATQNHEQLAHVRRHLSLATNHPDAVYSHRLTFELMLAFQGMSGALSREEVQSWRGWFERHRDHCTDAALDQRDPLPAIADTLAHLQQMISHPRSTYYWLVKNR